MEISMNEYSIEDSYMITTGLQASHLHRYTVITGGGLRDRY